MQNLENDTHKGETVKVPWNFEGNRFDHVAHAVSARWFTPPLSRFRIQNTIKEGWILVNNSQQEVRFRVSKGDSFFFTEAFFKNNNTSLIEYPKGDEPTVLEENEFFVAFYKPAAWLTHKVENYQKEGTLEEWALEKGFLTAEIENSGRVHRLDRNTSGIILYAKTNDAQVALKDLFRERGIKKRYIALVEGHLPETEGSIDQPIIRLKGSFKRVIAKSLAELGAKEAQTNYKLLKRFDNNDFVLVSPQTGRTHQIRVHMNFLGTPIVGDALYGGNKDILERQFLHAWAISFVLLGLKYSLKCPMPKDLHFVLESLDGSEAKSYDNEALQALGLKY